MNADDAETVPQAKQAEQTGSRWAATMHPGLGNEMVHRWNCYSDMLAFLKSFRAHQLSNAEVWQRVTALINKAEGRDV